MRQTIEQAKEVAELPIIRERAHIYVKIKSSLLEGKLIVSVISLAPAAAISFVNYGRSPAIITSIVARVSVGKDPPALMSALESSKHQHRIGEIISVKGGSNIKPIEVRLPEGDHSIRLVTNSVDGSVGLWVDGRVQYQDIFKRVRHTDFCRKLSYVGYGLVETDVPERSTMN